MEIVRWNDFCILHLFRTEDKETDYLDELL